MASEYIKYQLRDLKPAEPEKPLTGKEKIKNWFDYHKWYLIIAAVLLVIAIDLIHSSFSAARNIPDYQIAYIGSRRLPDDTVEAFERAASEYAVDITGNGKADVSLVQYVKNTEEAAGNDAVAGNNSASEVRLMADLESCDSAFFLLEDPESFNTDYDVLMEMPGGRIAVPFTETEGLGGKDYGTYEEVVAGSRVNGSSEDLLKGLFLARRMPREDADVEKQVAYDIYWMKIAGADLA